MNELLEGFEERRHRRLEELAWLTCSIVNNVWSGKPLRRDQLVRPRRRGRGGEPDPGAPRFHYPGSPGWEEFIAKFPEKVRKLINGDNR